MKIGFQIKTNMNPGSVPMINTLRVLSGAAGFVVDRDETTEIEPTFEGQSDVYTMTWNHCYVWDGETARYEFTDDEIDALLHADAEFEIEDEAPEDEYYEILDMYIAM